MFRVRRGQHLIVNHQLYVNMLAVLHQSKTGYTRSGFSVLLRVHTKGSGSASDHGQDEEAGVCLNATASQGLSVLQLLPVVFH